MKLQNYIVLLILILAVGCGTPQTVEEEPVLKIGAIFPMTGPAAVYGEQMRDGMLLAQEELAAEGINVEIIIEDSQAKSAVGVAAYNKLMSIDKVDVMFTAFSRVSVPLISLADQHEMPLIMTLVSAEDAASKSPFAFRLFSTHRQYTDPHFVSFINKEDYPRIAVMYVQDEYGESIHGAIKENAEENEITIVATEPFEPSTTDFRAQLTKIKGLNPDAILFVGAVPSETVNAVKQVRELEIEADFLEQSSLLGVPGIRAPLGDAAEGIITVAYPFGLGMSGVDFNTNFKTTYGHDPFFAAAFGYDGIQLLGTASQGKKMSGQELVDAIHAVKDFKSANGIDTITADGEINPEVYSTRIINGSLVQI